MAFWLRRAVGRFCSGLRCLRGFVTDAPLALVVVALVLALLAAIGSVLHRSFRWLAGHRGATVLEIVSAWLFVRLVARVVLFPGSSKLFQRSIEAMYRRELARHYVSSLKQLLQFLHCSAEAMHDHVVPVAARFRLSPDDISQACTIVRTLAEGFRQQQRDAVALNREQKRMSASTQDLEQWLSRVGVRSTAPAGSSKVATPEGDGSLIPLEQWVNMFVQEHRPLEEESLPKGGIIDPELAENLAGPEATLQQVAKVEQLLGQLDVLRAGRQKSWLRSATTFLRSPCVGSLHQLRAELQLRYSGEQCWIPRRRGLAGRPRGHLDGMLLPRAADAAVAAAATAAKAEGGGSHSSTQQIQGPVVLYCGPNAHYYEATLYQNEWIDFWRDRGFSIFLFNYSGYGRSRGWPSPAQILEDGDSIVRYLISRGAKSICIYGRSIGGITACHLAHKHPELVRLLVVDRTMATLESAAESLYGSWAARGLRISSMVGGNLDNYWSAKCRKVMICDPKDGIILDIAALRTAVAGRVLELTPEGERLNLPEGTLERFCEVWRFLDAVLEACDDDGHDSHESASFLAPAAASDSAEASGASSFSGASGSAGGVPGSVIAAGGSLVTGGGSTGAASPRSLSASPQQQPLLTGATAASSSFAASSADSSASINIWWVKANPVAVRSAVMPIADAIRSALDVVAEGVNGGGVVLGDTFLEHPRDPMPALQCLLANLQVWGAWDLDNNSHWLCADEDERDERGLPDEDRGASEGGPSARAASSGGRDALDREIEEFLWRVPDYYYEETVSQPTPEMLLAYHRRNGKRRVAKVLSLFRKRLSGVRKLAGAAATRATGNPASAQAAPDLGIIRATLRHFEEVDEFLATLLRQLKILGVSQELAGRGGHTDATIGEAMGHLIHVDSGHNGKLEEVDYRQLALHVQLAQKDLST
eukprot:TRINITY_DN10930_c0_g3_i1.p1 TRINITY_DN10930_c0_g3~~TRINITY_DN10930_c0_g3_i1.p1  ORF type:complete len:945 (+),score=228.63 TRINITY_DN10930_c0_g3_i1:32-2836(+)